MAKSDGGPIARRQPAKLLSPVLEQVPGPGWEESHAQRKQEVLPPPASSSQRALLPGRGLVVWGGRHEETLWLLYFYHTQGKRALGGRLLGCLPPVGRPLSLSGRSGAFKPSLSTRTTRGDSENPTAQATCQTDYIQTPAGRPWHRRF